MKRPEKAMRQVLMHDVGTPVLSFYSPALHSIITYGDPRRECQGTAVDTKPGIMSPPGTQVPQSFILRCMKGTRGVISQKLGPEEKQIPQFNNNNNENTISK